MVGEGKEGFPDMCGALERSSGTWVEGCRQDTTGDGGGRRYCLLDGVRPVLS